MVSGVLLNIALGSAMDETDGYWLCSKPMDIGFVLGPGGGERMDAWLRILGELDPIKTDYSAIWIVRFSDRWDSHLS
jgi:hypothetical protein